ncbi:hypothetical protein Dsin_009070 [Dipteronia sinensis]|uniref:Uncharacterized protein n=1 Tax=Dipteronia sinensis TaxID=43782 RepID=A0AAE0AQS6_9ROSI|nr:hypothetical protein Dsin_009070 [Dipteronia sinensis]
MRSLSKLKDVKDVYKELVALQQIYLGLLSCSLEEIHRRHRQVSAVIIGEVIAPRLQQQDVSLMRPKDIIADMKTMYGIQIMYRASLRGFRRCMCSVITIYGTHLKGRFGGTTFVATAQDGNRQVYPVAFGYDDSENNLLWE